MVYVVKNMHVIILCHTVFSFEYPLDNSRYRLRFPLAMNGSTIRGSLSGESWHIPNNSKILGCLKLFILAHSSIKLFMPDLECISESVNFKDTDDEFCYFMHKFCVASCV